jgi:hypothetical protein
MTASRSDRMRMRARAVMVDALKIAVMICRP